MNIIPFTKEGLAKLQRDHDELTEKRQETVKSLSRAREMGDLSENGLYKAAKSELADIDRNLRRIKYFLTHSFAIKNTSGGSVGLGSKILLETKGETKTFEIVGDFEADPKQGKISQNSPLGKNLMNRKVNETVTIISPNAKQTVYKILRIS